MDYNWLSLAMFVVALGLLSAGYPVAFTLSGVALLFCMLPTAISWVDPEILVDPNLLAMPQEIFATMLSNTLLAIPYFIFMGAMLEKSGLAEKLLETIGILFGPIRGGLALAVVFVGALLAATTGVVDRKSVV